MAGLRVSLWLIAAVMTVAAAGCTPQHQEGTKSVHHEEPEGKKKSSAAVKDKKVIALKDRHFDEAAGWLDNETVIYTATDPVAGSEVKSYDIFKGTGETIYKTDDRLIAAEVNREKGMILIQTAGNGSEMKLTLLNLQGKQLYTKKFRTHELQVDWNRFDPYLLYVTTFTKDWNYESRLIDAKEQQTEKDIAQAAFVHWTSADTFEYIKWNERNREKPAPVYSFNTADGREKKLAGDAVLLDVLGDMRLIVAPSSSHRQGTYIFSDVSSSKKKISFKLPLFSEYGSLSPMEYSYDPRHELFYTYQPNESGSLYDLISVSLKTGKREVIREKVEMLPITVSPDGDYALYGYTQDQIISFNSKTAAPLVTKE